MDGALSAFGTGGNNGDNSPGAYLNYILFDKNYNVLDMGWEIATGYNAQQKVSITDIPVTEAGYIFIYLSYENESNNYVQFDDLKVTHRKTNVIQYNEYYPFGLQTSNSWTREGSSNNYLYNEGNELNPTTGWYNMFFRDYDPALGRMLQVDPYAFNYVSRTPYNYTFNSPVLLTDPSGGSTPEMRDLSMELMTTDWSVWMPGNGVFGHRGPGSGQHWSDQNSTPYRDYFLMGGNNF